jgi:hypothetical protein
MTARWTHQPPRRIGLQPPLVFAPVPDSILRSQHPATALAVEHREVAHGDSESARLKIPRSPLFDEELVADLGVGEWIDGHAREYGVVNWLESNRLKGPQHASHHIPKLDSIRRTPRFFLTFQAE